MTSPHPIVRWDGTASCLYPLGPFRCIAISNKGGAWKLACVNGPALVGDRVTKDAEGRLCKVGKPA